MEIGKAVEVRVHLKLIDRFAFKQSSEKIILVLRALVGLVLGFLL